MKGHAGKKRLGINSVGLATELSLISKLLQKVIPKKHFACLYRTHLDFIAWSNYLYIVSNTSRPTHIINKV